MILPRPKKYKSSGKSCRISLPLRICFSDSVSESLELAAGELLGVDILPVSSRADASVVLTASPSLSDKSEYCEICTSGGRAILTFTDFLGGRNALAILSSLISLSDGELELEEAEISDYPDMPFRSFMQDVGRKHIDIETLRMQILLMAKCRLNVLHFHFTEYVGFAIAFKRFPELRGAPVTGGAQYTEEEITELVAYASSLGIDVIPEIDLPAHANSITDAFPRLACDTVDGVKPHGWALCVTAEETYQLLEKMIRETCRLFPSRYFHLGTDEISMPDVDRVPRPVSDWSRCRRCLALAERQGLRTDRDVDLFYYFLRRVYGIVKSFDRRLIIWNDQIDISVSPDLPRDIIIEFWRVAAPLRGPHEGCSMQRFVDEGFDVINAYYPETYIDLYVNYDRLSHFNPLRTTATDDGRAGQIIGSDFCAWDVFAHFDHSVPTSIVSFGERYTNAMTDGFGEDFPLGMSELLFGIKGFSIFDYTRDVILLDGEDIFKETADPAEVIRIIDSFAPKNIIEKYIHKTYRALAEESLSSRASAEK